MSIATVRPNRPLDSIRSGDPDFYLDSDDPMNYRTLGRTGLSVSEIGYGGGRVRPGQDIDKTKSVLNHAIDSGVNFFDTAPTYGGGLGEEIIGQVIAGRRDSVILATKTKPRDPAGIIETVEGSLGRLGIETVDILQFHGGWIPSEDADQILNEGGLETYLKLKEEGKIRFLAFSADGPGEGVLRLIRTGHFDAIQCHYNLFYQAMYDGFCEEGIMAEAEKEGMGIFTMRSTTSNAFPSLMKQCFPEFAEANDLDSFLLNYTLSNPLVDSALMSLESIAAVNACAKVSDDVESRIDIRAIHGR